MKKTYSAKLKDVKRKWYIVDAKDKILGRLATRVATVLLGKHKPMFTPHIDTGDYVIVINSSKIRVTGNKLKEKIYQRYSGYPSGRKEITLEALLKRQPTRVMREAVRRMLPTSPLGRKMIRKLKIYADENHPFKTQGLVSMEVS